MNPKLSPDADIPGANNMWWDETHAEYVGLGRKLLNFGADLIQLVVCCAICFYPGLLISQHWHLKGVFFLWPTLIMGFALFCLFAFRFLIIDPLFEYPTFYTKLRGYSGYYGVRRNGFALYFKYLDDPLEVSFSCTPNAGKKRLRNKRVVADKIQSFVVTTESEWMGIPNPPPSVPSSFVILVDLGDGESYEVCRHFGHKGDVVRLHGLLTKAFVTERPKPSLRPVAADDPI